MFCKYFLSVCHLSFHSLKSPLHREIFNDPSSWSVCLSWIVLSASYAGKSIPAPKSSRFSPFLSCSSSGLYIFFYHPFWINIFVRTVRAVSRFVFLPVDVPLFQHLFLTFIYFWPRGVFTAACGLSLGAMSRGCSSLRCGGFSLWGLPLLCSLALGLGLSS